VNHEQFAAEVAGTVIEALRDERILVTTSSNHNMYRRPLCN